MVLIGARAHPCNKSNIIFNIVLQQFKVTSDVTGHIVNIGDKSPIINRLCVISVIL